MSACSHTPDCAMCIIGRFKVHLPGIKVMFERGGEFALTFPENIPESVDCDMLAPVIVDVVTSLHEENVIRVGSCGFIKHPTGSLMIFRHTTGKYSVGYRVMSEEEQEQVLQKYPAGSLRRYAHRR